VTELLTVVGGIRKHRQDRRKDRRRSVSRIANNRQSASHSALSAEVFVFEGYNESPPLALAELTIHHLRDSDAKNGSSSTSNARAHNFDDWMLEPTAPLSTTNSRSSSSSIINSGTVVESICHLAFGVTSRRFKSKTSNRNQKLKIQFQMSITISGHYD
jgi:hypothetical protein